MGKKYIPVVMRNCDYRVFLENVSKVYTKVHKIIPPPPPYKKTAIRKESLETCGDEDIFEKVTALY